MTRPVSRLPESHFLDDHEISRRLEQATLQCLLRAAPESWPGLEEQLRAEAGAAAREAQRLLGAGLFEHRWRAGSGVLLVGEERKIGTMGEGDSVFVEMHAGARLSAELRHSLELRAPARALLICRADAYAPLCFYEPQIRLVPALPPVEELLSRLRPARRQAA
jgi:hypothetical protein